MLDSTVLKKKNENENITNYFFSFLLFLPKLSSKESLQFLFKKKILYKVHSLPKQPNFPQKSSPGA